MEDMDYTADTQFIHFILPQDTIDKFSAMEALPNFAGLVDEQNQLLWEEIVG